MGFKTLVSLLPNLYETNVKLIIIIFCLFDKMHLVFTSSKKKIIAIRYFYGFRDFQIDGPQNVFFLWLLLVFINIEVILVDNMISKWSKVCKSVHERTLIFF